MAFLFKFVLFVIELGGRIQSQIIQNVVASLILRFTQYCIWGAKMFEELIEELFFRYKDRAVKSRPLIVAIDGLGGAGKTTLVKNIENELKNKCTVSVIHIDDHIVESNKRYNTGSDEWYEYYYLQWDIEIIRDDLLRKIHNNYTELNLPFYDKFYDRTVLKNITIASDSIVLIEGVFLLREEWGTFYDYTIFVDCPREIRYERVLNRDSYIGDYRARLSKYKKRYWPGEEYYLKTENPIKKADKIFYVTL